MTKQAQRKAIAEACGEPPQPDWQVMSPEERKYPDSQYAKWHVGARKRYPDYLNDLNAMRQAEEYAATNLMNADQWEAYGRALEHIHPTARLEAPDGSIDYHDFASLMCLSAAARAEAFLRCLGKWDDSK